MHTLFVISAPSGCGKTSLIRETLPKYDTLSLSISHTTRTMRADEEHGVHYFFISLEEFEKLITRDVFVEYATVFDNKYGTSKEALVEMLTTKHVIVEIDWQGARQIKKHFSNAVSIFILPPSIEALKERLTIRGDDEEVIIRRMSEAEAEISHSEEYDHIIINDDFSTAIAELDSIIRDNI